MPPCHRLGSKYRRAISTAVLFPPPLAPSVLPTVARPVLEVSQVRTGQVSSKYAYTEVLTCFYKFWPENQFFIIFIEELNVQIYFFAAGGHGRRNVSADLQMAASYAAQVAHREDQFIPASHSPDNYRQNTSNGNSVRTTFQFDKISQRFSGVS